MIYWENNREKQRKTYRQFLLGIPIALLFVLPIAVNFFAGWYKRADMVRGGQEFNPGVLLAALLIITGFIAIFSRRFRWDQNEQHYKETVVIVLHTNLNNASKLYKQMDEINNHGY